MKFSSFINYEQVQINISCTNCRFEYYTQTFDLYSLSAKKVLKDIHEEKKMSIEQWKNSHILITRHTYFKLNYNYCLCI